MSYKHTNALKSRTMLWVGLGLFAISIVANIIISLCGVMYIDDVNPIDLFVPLKGGIVVGAIVAVIFIPLVEELAFRFWGRGTKVAYIIDIVLIPCFVFIDTRWWVAALIALAALLLIFLLMKGRARFWAMTIATVAIFLLLHVKSFDLHNIHSLFYATQILGLALVCTYLCVQKGFMWAVGAHICNNLLAFLLAFIPTQVAMEDYTLRITPLYEREYGLHDKQGDVAIFRSDMASILGAMAYEQEEQQHADPMERATFYRTDYQGLSMMKTYTLRITPRQAGSPIDYNKIIDTLHRMGYGIVDTTYEAALILNVVDDSLLSASHEGRAASIGTLIAQLRNEYSIPLQPSSGLNCSYPIKIQWKNISQCATWEEADTYLRETYGLAIAKSNRSKVQIVTFRNK